MSISKVIYATEHNEEISSRAKKYLKNGYGALVGIELAGGIDAGKKFIKYNGSIKKKNYCDIVCFKRC